MLSFALNSFNTLSFLSSRDLSLNKLVAKLSSYKQAEKQVYADTTTTLNSCSCHNCNWRGKRSEAKKEFLLLTEAVGFDLFCPNCNSYMNFVYYKD